MKKGTQTKILDSAETLFWNQGHKATSLEKIARHAGQSKGSIFHYFRGKDDITQLVLKKYAQEELYDPLQNCFAQNTNVKEALLSWLESIYTSYRQKTYKSGCLLGNMALELADRDEATRAELARIFLDLENKLVGGLKAQADDKQIVMEHRQFARLLIAALQGVTMTIKVHKDKNRAAREFQALGELVERMVKG